MTSNIGTKEHNNEELNFSSSLPWGPPTLEQKKNTMMRIQALHHHVHGTCNPRTKKYMMSSCGCGPGDLQHLNKKNTMTRSRAPHHCVSRACNIETKKMHDDEEPSSLSLCASVTCNIGTKEHDKEELRSSSL
jgi:hypothetical protein